MESKHNMIFWSALLFILRFHVPLIWKQNKPKSTHFETAGDRAEACAKCYQETEVQLSTDEVISALWRPPATEIALPFDKWC